MMPTTRSMTIEVADVETFATSRYSEVLDLRKRQAMLADVVERQSSAVREQAETSCRQEARMQRLMARASQNPSPPPM